MTMERMTDELLAQHQAMAVQPELYRLARLGLAASTALIATNHLPRDGQRFPTVALSFPSQELADGFYNHPAWNDE